MRNSRASNANTVQAAIDFGIDARPDRDPLVLCSRFARHPTLRSVELVGGSTAAVSGAAS